MQLKTTTDYAIRAVICLASNGSFMSSRDIAKKMGIPPKYLINIMVILRENKIIASIQGSGGGYYLARDPMGLTLWDVIRAMEPTMLINRCIVENEFCSHDCVANCPTRQVYMEAQKSLEKCLSIPVGDIVED